VSFVACARTSWRACRPAQAFVETSLVVVVVVWGICDVCAGYALAVFDQLSCRIGTHMPWPEAATGVEL
jgi:hypothetical protein